MSHAIVGLEKNINIVVDRYKIEINNTIIPIPANFLVDVGIKRSPKTISKKPERYTAKWGNLMYGGTITKKKPASLKCLTPTKI